MADPSPGDPNAPTQGAPTDAPNIGPDTGGFPQQAFPDSGSAFGIPETAFRQPTWMERLPTPSSATDDIFRKPDASDIDRGMERNFPTAKRRQVRNI